MKIGYAELLIAVLLTLLVSSILCVTYIKGLPDSFFNFNMMQVLTPVIQIAIAIGLAIFVNIKLSNKSKRNEIIALTLDEYLDASDRYFEVSSRYMNSKERELENQILSLHKAASRKLQKLEELNRLAPLPGLYPMPEMKKDLIEAKRIVTSSHFKQQTSYSTQDIRKLDELQNEIHTKTIKEKLSLYA